MDLKTPINETEILLIKGGLYETSPLLLITSVLVILNNILIVKCYYQDQTKFAHKLYIGIGLCDIVIAHGNFIITLIAILVFKFECSSDILYKALYYYQFTAVPGEIISKMLNLILTVTLTIHIIQPFRIIPIGRLKIATLTICVTMLVLALTDGSIYVYVLETDGFSSANDSFFFPYQHLVPFIFSDMTGAVTVEVILCTWPHPFQGACHITDNHKQFPLLFYYFFYTLISIHYFIFPLIIIFCAVLQLIHIRVGNLTRHVSITILLISSLFFICHVMYFLLIPSFVKPK